MPATLEAAAITKLKEQEANLKAEVDRNRRILTSQLQAVVPDSLSKWLKEAGDLVISDLLEHEQASRKYHNNREDGNDYGYTDFEEFKRRFTELRAAWQGVVAIAATWDGEDNHHFEVWFTAL
jgi:hypothetical protein